MTERTKLRARRDQLTKVFQDQDLLRKMEDLFSLKFGDIRGGNYFYIENSGIDVRFGDAIQWGDLSQALITAGLDTTSGRLTYDYFNSGISFAANARYPEEPVLTPIQGKHGMLIGAGAILKPHFHWLQQQADTPNFLLAYKMLNYGDTTTFEADYTNYTLLPWESNTYTYVAGVLAQITAFPEIDISTLDLSGSMDMVLFRDSANVSTKFSGVDPVATAATVKYNDSHAKFDMIGSRNENIK